MTKTPTTSKSKVIKIDASHLHYTQIADDCEDLLEMISMYPDIVFRSLIFESVKTSDVIIITSNGMNIARLFTSKLNWTTRK